MPPNGAETAAHDSLLLTYLKAAMARAHDEPSSGDGFYYGTIGDFDEVSARALSSEECRNRLQLALAEWLLFRVSTNLPLPQVDSINLTFDTTAEKSSLIRDLQQEIRILKRALLSHSNSFSKFLRGVPSFVLSNWNFVAFIITLAMVAGLYYHYGVNTYLENIRTLYTNKETAKKYSRLGDRLTEYGETPLAEGAYNTALKLDPNNTDAVIMIYILGILPKEGEAYLPEVIDTKLRATKEIFKQDKSLSKYLYILSYFEGQRQREQSHYTEAKSRYKEAISENGNFIYGYVALAEVQVANKESLDDRISTFENALKIDSDYAVVLNNLGASYLIKEDFGRAIQNLEKAVRLAPYLETFVQLGDAYRYSNQFQKAFEEHAEGLKNINDPVYQQQRYVGSSSYDFMPDGPGQATASRYINVAELKDHKMVVSYALSFDYALLGKYKEANSAFQNASQLGGNQDMSEFFANRISYIENKLTLDDSQRKWFATHKNLLKRRKE
jgi:tetratricopeptide (TPR) repeat protein